jgi:branched-chain amino acid transport system substrate-binding protein
MLRKFLTVCAIASLAMFASPQTKAADPIKIGGLLETSGFLASLGKPGLEGAQLAVEEINAAGGIKGAKVIFTNINTESDNTKAVSAAKRLMEQNGVVGIIGAMNSGSSYAIINTVQRAKIPVIANGGSRGIVLPPEKKQWMFLAPLTDVLVQSVMMNDMKKKGITKIALVNADSGFGTSGRKQLEKHAAAYGIKIVLQQTYGNSDKDMTPQMAKVRASDAQATVIWATGAGQAIATKNHRQLGIKTPLYLSHAANDFNFIRLAGGAANGVLIPSSKLYVLDALKASDPQKPVIAKFVDGYKKKYGRPPATFAGNGYDAAKMMMAAIARAGTDPAKLRAAIESTKDYVGVTAVYSYSPTDHFGAQASSVVLLSVAGGKFILAK